MTPPSPTEPFAERRRYPRAAPADLAFGMPVGHHAEVLDLSSTGALLSVAAPLKVGQRVQLRMALEREPFTAWVEVRRIDVGTMADRGRRTRAGVTFLSIDDKSQRTLQRFLRDDPRSG